MDQQYPSGEPDRHDPYQSTQQPQAAPAAPSAPSAPHQAAQSEAGQSHTMPQPYVAPAPYDANAQWGATHHYQPTDAYQPVDPHQPVDPRQAGASYPTGQQYPAAGPYQPGGPPYQAMPYEPASYQAGWQQSQVPPVPPQSPGWNQSMFQQPPAPKRPARRTGRVLIACGIVGAVAVGGFAAGVASHNSFSLGNQALSSGQSGTGSSGSGSSGSGSSGSGSSGSGSSGGSSSGGGFGGGFGNGGGFGFGGGTGSGGTGSGGTGSGGTGGTGGGGTGSTGATASSAQQVGVVDIVTQLQYQNAEAAGTGMILNSKGEILTNNHVIDGATSIKVTVVATGQTYTATVVGDDPTADVAVIQLQNASGLKTINLGDSSKVNVGDAVTAVGNAGGVGGTPSAASGTVQALGQSITATDDSGGNPEQLTNLIESNAPIQAGDSGGPLYTASGAVVGMDTAGNASSSDSTATEAYSIPINTALSVVKQIESGNATTSIHIGLPPFIGVEFSAASGPATIAGVVSGSPAASAGLAAGDTITGIGSTSISAETDVKSALANYKAGQSVKITWTDASGQSHSASLTLVAGPAD